MWGWGGGRQSGGDWRSGRGAGAPDPRRRSDGMRGMMAPPEEPWADGACQRTSAPGVAPTAHRSRSLGNAREEVYV